MHQVGCHLSRHDAGRKPCRAYRPLPRPVDIRHGGGDGLLHIQHSGLDGNLLFKGPADDGPLRARKLSLDAQRTCREGEKNMLTQSWINRLRERCNHQLSDTLFKLLIPSALLNLSRKLVVEEETDDKPCFTLWSCAAVVEDRDGDLVGVQAAESLQPSIEPLSIQSIPIREQRSKIRSMKLAQALPRWSVEEMSFRNTGKVRRRQISLS